MKKDHAKILAAGLYQASKNKKGKELDTVIANFSAYLNQHHLVSMISKILIELEKFHFQAEGIVATKIVSKEELSEAEVKKIVNLVKARIKQTVEVKTETDQDLLGGAVIKYNDKIIDMSLKRQLVSLQKQLNN
ncbi:ATP synthase F1 subunit delta [bacterium]|nr:ATP synthase F1 subunit delta [bacterium]